MPALICLTHRESYVVRRAMNLPMNTLYYDRYLVDRRSTCSTGSSWSLCASIGCRVRQTERDRCRRAIIGILRRRRPSERSSAAVYMFLATARGNFRRDSTRWSPDPPAKMLRNLDCRKSCWCCWCCRCRFGTSLSPAPGSWNMTAMIRDHRQWWRRRRQTVGRRRSPVMTAGRNRAPPSWKSSSSSTSSLSSSSP